jgi:hypothetical protein
VNRRIYWKRKEEKINEIIKKINKNPVQKFPFRTKVSIILYHMGKVTNKQHCIPTRNHNFLIDEKQPQKQIKQLTNQTKTKPNIQTKTNQKPKPEAKAKPTKNETNSDSKTQAQTKTQSKT